MDFALFAMIYAFIRDFLQFVFDDRILGLKEAKNNEYSPFQ
jgi:hypothetical protein